MTWFNPFTGTLAAGIVLLFACLYVKSDKEYQAHKYHVDCHPPKEENGQITEQELAACRRSREKIAIDYMTIREAKAFLKKEYGYE